MQEENREAAFDRSSSPLSRIRSATGLPPVQRRNVWIASGIFVQLVAVGGPVAWIAARAKHDSMAGIAFRSTVLVAAHELLRSSSGLAVLAGSAVVFALGSVLLARPFVRSLVTLLVAVPLAAVVGVLVLGAFAVVVAVVALLAAAGGDDYFPGTTGGGKRRSRGKAPLKKPPG